MKKLEFNKETMTTVIDGKKYKLVEEEEKHPWVGKRGLFWDSDIGGPISVGFLKEIDSQGMYIGVDDESYWHNFLPFSELEKLQRKPGGFKFGDPVCVKARNEGWDNLRINVYLHYDNGHHMFNGLIWEECMHLSEWLELAKKEGWIKEPDNE